MKHRSRSPFLVLLIAPACAAPDAAGPESSPAADTGAARIEGVPFTQVRITGGFWAPRLETNRAVTVPYALEQCERTGRIANFAVAGGLEEGGFEGIYFNDSDVFKVVEGASLALATRADPELEARLDELVAKIAAAQEEDGYLYTIRTIQGSSIEGTPGPARWSNLAGSHELYNVGHLYEAAVAHHAATGKRTLLDVAVRNANLVARTFGPGAGQHRDPPGHQEIEIGLVKLAQATGDERYAELARFFLEQRGRHAGRRSYGPYSQDHVPVTEQREAVGHAVRAGYQYSAMADVAAATRDAAYLGALDALWRDVVGRKMYLTGGVGATRHGEAFGEAWDLPNASAYAETCAAVAQILWNQRLFLLHGDARYVDVLERVLYNGFLSGVALQGDRFFYPNPLASDGRTPFNIGDLARSPWFSCSCCPVNVVRAVPSIPGLVYAVAGGAVWVNLYTECDATLEQDGVPVAIAQRTEYPWDGRVRLAVDPEVPVRFELRLRIPGWARGRPLPGELYSYADPEPSVVALEVCGERAPLQARDGYAVIEREWRRGDTVELELGMPVRRVVADPRVVADRGRVALERGPVVYCFEGLDNGGRVADLVLDDEAPVRSVMESGLLGGAVVLSASASRVVERDGRRALEPLAERAIPYHLWAHRGAGPMAVWVARDADTAELPTPPPFAARFRAAASHTWSNDTATALNDGVVPRSSSDQDLPRFTFWDHRGGTEWVQYESDEALAVAGVELYWFDDTGVGQCRVPAAWRLLHRTDGEWRSVPGADGRPAAKDRFDVVRFAAVTTSALRIEVELAEGFSGGILEWRVLPAD